VISLFLYSLFQEPELLLLWQYANTEFHFVFNKISRSFQRIHPSSRPCVTFCNMLVSYDCKLSTTAYSTYLQLPPKYEGHHLHLQPQNMLCHGDRDPLNMEKIMRNNTWWPRSFDMFSNGDKVEDMQYYYNTST